MAAWALALGSAIAMMGCAERAGSDSIKGDDAPPATPPISADPAATEAPPIETPPVAEPPAPWRGPGDVDHRWHDDPECWRFRQCLQSYPWHECRRRYPELANRCSDDRDHDHDHDHDHHHG